MDAVEDIKSRLSIEDVVSEYVELKRAGRNFKALSPFSSEKTPSLMVSPEKQIWHDFSSGKGGNMFSFVMEMEGVDFKGALEILARKAGVDLDQYRSASSAKLGQQKKRLLACLELAAKFYQVHFSKNEAAYTYMLKTRHFSKDTALAFRFGYSPTTGNALVRYLTGKGFSTAEIRQAGLATIRSGGPSDMFRGRIMIPLMDALGAVIGFTARLMQDEPNAPKYINTPASPVYDKSRHVFGLHLAKEAIRKADYGVVVEGNLDVMASYQAGVKNVVATAGTAMTEMHLKELGRFTQDVRLAFDEDAAGVAATERTIALAQKSKVSLSIITIPSGKDPDELIQKDSGTWQKIIEQPQYALDWLIEHYKKQHDITSAEGKRRFSDQMVTVLRQIQDSVERDHYMQQVASDLGVAKAALESKLSTVKAPTTVHRKPKASVAQVSRTEADHAKTQNQLLALCLMQPQLRVYLSLLIPEMFSTEEARQLLPLLQDPKATSEAVLGEVGDYGKILTLLYEELYSHLEFVELRYEAARLQVRLIEQFTKIQKTLLAHHMQGASEQIIQELLEKAKKLDHLLKKTKEL